MRVGIIVRISLKAEWIVTIIVRNFEEVAVILTGRPLRTMKMKEIECLKWNPTKQNVEPFLKVFLSAFE
ncbi:unnamed protein product [Larinioides sclopetarius]|uniref:Uncharacterized protein n=1 Tax=Larinioides sclopetarius TaxID=280406 RepID=A0AAV2BAA7_9ARAC